MYWLFLLLDVGTAAPPLRRVCASVRAASRQLRAVREALQAAWQARVETPAGGGVGAVGGAPQEPGECASDADCEERWCIPREFDGIPGEVVGLDGVCAEIPPVRSLSIRKISPIKLTGSIVPRDLVRDSYEALAEEVYDLSQSLRTFRFEGGPYESVNVRLPGDPKLLQFRFYWQAEVILRVAASSGASMPNGDIECRLVVDSMGDVIDGGMLRESGELLCSRSNWLASQSEDEPGLLVELEVTATPEPSNL